MQKQRWNIEIVINKCSNEIRNAKPFYNNNLKMELYILHIFMGAHTQHTHKHTEACIA